MLFDPVLFNGVGQRVVKKIKSGVIATTRTYLYGQNGELLAEIGPKGDVFREYIYLNGKPLALLKYTTDSNENFLAADIDGDGNISIEDYILWYMNYFITGDLSKDINGDGILDNTDTSILVSCALTPASCRAASYKTEIYYIHNDHLGTPKVLTDEAGRPVWRALADPFGKATVDEDVDGDGRNVVMNFRFPGQYYDAESGLHYNYFRTYDPALGRYITSDPIGLLGGVNTYSYVLNNPSNLIDPLGLEPSPWGAGVVDAYIQGQGEAMFRYVELQVTAGAIAMGIIASPAVATATAAVVPGLMCGATETAVVTSPIWGSPVVQQGVIDFSQGFFMPGPPPMSPAGIAGSGTRSLYEQIITNQR